MPARPVTLALLAMLLPLAGAEVHHHAHALSQASVDADEELTSPNVTPVGVVPGSTSVISTAFFADEPLMVASTLTGVRTYDVSDPEQPVLLGAVPMAFWQNENVKVGERDNGTRFALIGYDAAGISPTFNPENIGTYDEVVIVDVTDPAQPAVAARVDTTHRTHTIGCANDACTHAFVSGDSHAFDVIAIPDNLEEAEVVATVDDQPMAPSPGIASSIGHDWDVDDADVAWWVGTGGIIAYDVTEPTEPIILNSSDEHGTDPEWNNYISHNSLRPNAEQFDADDAESPDGPGRRPAHRGNPREDGPPSEGPAGPPAEPDDDGPPTDGDDPSVHHGDVLLVTEEDYLDPSCRDEGAFQTWHVPDLDPAINPDGEQGGGTITPLDKWNTEVAGTGVATPGGALCSAHYFTYHQDGYVAAGFYQQGLRILDVNDATDIRQVGYFVTGVQETWGAGWVPEYDQDGRQTGAMTDLVYTEDPTRGIEIFRVDLAAEGSSRVPAVRAPVVVPQGGTVAHDTKRGDDHPH